MIIINERNNIAPINEDFCFQLTIEELEEMWFHFGTTLEKENMKYRSEKHFPYVYTQQAISMLSGVSKQLKGRSLRPQNHFITQF